MRRKSVNGSLTTYSLRALGRTLRGPQVLMLRAAVRSMFRDRELVFSVVVAVGTAADSVRGIAEAQLAAALVVTVASAELRAIESREQTAAANLPRNGRKRVLRAGRSGGGALCWIAHTCPGATVSVADQHASDCVDGDVIEVQ